MYVNYGLFIFVSTLGSFSAGVNILCSKSVILSDAVGEIKQTHLCLTCCDEIFNDLATGSCFVDNYLTR